MGASSLDARSVTVILNCLTVVGLVVSTIFAGILLRDNYDAVQLTIKTVQLSSELRQSSDDLTRFIRTYTVTGNASYWGYFQQVIGIRNGVLPLPDEPWRNYWDLYITDGHPPRGFLPPAALLDRIRDAQFTQAELDLLTEAARQSDALIDLEDVAYHAMNGRYRPRNTTGLTQEEALAFSVRAPPNQTLAMELVHGTFYHHWKGLIMRPIDEFAAMSARRVQDAIERNYRNNVALICVLAAMVMVLIAVLLIYFLKVAKDSQTQHLLSAVLPERVVDSITIGQFHSLRDVAADRAKAIRRQRGVFNSNANDAAADGSAASPVPSSFPVLYSEYLPMAWVAFTDIVGFTKMCRYTESNAVIALLNELFSMLDIAAIKYKVEKIKTIGDAFMAAKLSTSELQDDASSDAHDVKLRNERVAHDGIEIVQFLLRAASLARGCARPIDANPTVAKEDEAAPSVPFLELRMGLHAGPCASGIVGFERPLYDLFGDTVNTAARLEATGRPGRVHVLESTIGHFGSRARDLLCDGHCESVALKGLGTATTRFIMGTTAAHGDDSESTLQSGLASARRIAYATSGGLHGSMEIVSPPLSPSARAGIAGRRRSAPQLAEHPNAVVTDV